jgi:hypothetical protein
MRRFGMILQDPSGRANMRPSYAEAQSRTRHQSAWGHPKVFRYIVAHNSGFAPCFDAGICSLACCKPNIRRTATVGDWVLGFAPRRQGEARLLYMMRVGTKLDFSSYARDRRFHRRQDNIWHPNAAGGFRRMPARGVHDTPEAKARDLRGRYVLVADKFRDFGTDGLDLCAAVGTDIARRLWYSGRGHKVNGLLPGDLRALLAALDGFGHSGEIKTGNPCTSESSCG